MIGSAILAIAHLLEEFLHNSCTGATNLEIPAKYNLLIPYRIRN
jgi:hypothetical protein